MNEIPRHTEIIESRFDQILLVLYFGSLRQRELKEIMEISGSWLSEILSKMEKLGLIHREPIGRTNIVRITEKGKEYILGTSQYSIKKIKILISRMLGHSKTTPIEIEREGITFDYKVPGKKEKLIKIVEGVIVPKNLELLEKILDRLKKYRTEERRTTIPLVDPWHGEVFRVLRDLLNEKGAILATVRYAMTHQESCDILLIILGAHPDNWPEILAEIIDTIGEITNQNLAIRAQGALQKVLKNKPKNLTIIFTQGLKTKELVSKIETFIQHQRHRHI